MSNTVLVLPYAYQPYYEECKATLDLPAKILAVDNTGPEGTTSYNCGVAESWNRGLKQGADQTLICSQMVRFAPADLSRRPERWGLDFVAENIERYANPYGMTFGDQGFHLISIGRKTVNTIGLFDENFLAYGEDDDYSHRLSLAGIRMGGWGNNADGSFDKAWLEAGIFSIAYGALNRGGVINTGKAGRMLDYYSHKWCSPGTKYPGDYKTPFNNPDAGLDYWPKVKYEHDELDK